MTRKIERTIADIDKTKAIIAEYQTKLRELEQRKTELENAEIIALYRKERMTEDDFRAFIQSRREADDPPVTPQMTPSATTPAPKTRTKEIAGDED